MNNSDNNKMFTFEYIVNNYFNKYEVYIPIIQRNYKWDKETAAKLVTDLWDAFDNKRGKYTAGMITTYKEEEKENGKTKMQLVDGQQRIITLYMLLKIIDPSKEYFTFKFERDDGLEEKKTREYYLKNINNHKEYSIVDTDRFKENYYEMDRRLKEAKNYSKERHNEFCEYIMKNLYMLMHISEIEPFDEFMNINKNKTRFVISDRIKTNLLLDSKKENKEEVLELFEQLSKSMFTDKVWDLVSRGYTGEEIIEGKRKRTYHYKDENRLKLLCCERHGDSEYDVTSISKYDFKEELQYLKHYNELLKTIKEDMNAQKWKSYNAFNCMYEINYSEEKRFFSIIKEKKENYKIENYFLDEYKKLGYLDKNIFIEAQSLREERENKEKEEKKKEEKEEENLLKSIESKNDEWINHDEDDIKIFEEIYKQYIYLKYKK